MGINNDQLNSGYLTKGILGKLYFLIDKIGYKCFNRNSPILKVNKKLLFINLGLIGDLILFRYVIEDFLKLGYEIDILIQDEYKFIFIDYSDVNLITIKNYKDKKIFAGFIKIILALWKNKKNYDISCHFRGYLGTGILSTYLSRVAKSLIGYRTSGFGFLLNKVAKWRENVHETEHLLDVLRLLQPNYNYINLDVFDNLTNRDNLVKFNLKIDDYIVIHATSQDSRKNIPESTLSSIINYIQCNSSLKVVFAGSPDEIEYIVQAFPDEFDNYLITNGTLGFFDLRSLIGNARFFIGIDSSIAHLISNINKPKIVIWHNLNFCEQWRPLGTSFIIIRDNQNVNEILSCVKNYIVN